MELPNLIKEKGQGIKLPFQRRLRGAYRRGVGFCAMCNQYSIIRHFCMICGAER